jgi:transposase
MVLSVADHDDRVWAVEGANGMGRYIAQRLVAAGEVVVDVPAKLSTRVRVYSTGHGNKTDKTDAVATARAALHSKHLRFVQPDGANEALKLVVDRREQLVATRVQAVARLHRLIRELIPGGARRELTAEKAFDLVSGLEPGDAAGGMRVEMAMEYIDDIRALDLKIDQATARINRMVKESKTTLTRIYGVGPLNAALILGEVGNVGRFPSRNHFASYAGTAPIEVSSGDQRRHRLSRAGNRRLNKAIHVAAIVQIRFDCPGREFYLRKLEEGKSKKEAIRALKRHITDAIWRQLQIDRQHHQDQDNEWTRWQSTRRGNPSYRSPDTLRANGKPMRRREDPTDDAA